MHSNTVFDPAVEKTFFTYGSDRELSMMDA